MTCCTSPNQRDPNAPEFQKSFDPSKAGNCATCIGFGNVFDVLGMPENPPTDIKVVVISKLSRDNFSAP